MLTRITQTANRVLLSISTTVLALMMVLISVDVIMRYLFNAPLPGAFEVTEYLMAILIPFSIAYCGEKKGHVAVDLVYEHLPKPFRAALDIFTTFFSIVLTVFIMWQSVRYVSEVKASGLTSSVLLIPAYPFIVPTSIGMAVFVLVLLVQLFEFSKDTKKVEVSELTEIKRNGVEKG
jgi:TRAP-type transport system small permease protein